MLRQFPIIIETVKTVLMKLNNVHFMTSKNDLYSVETVKYILYCIEHISSTPYL